MEIVIFFLFISIHFFLVLLFQNDKKYLEYMFVWKSLFKK